MAEFAAEKLSFGEVMEHAEVLWNYLSSFSSESKSDALVVCCSYDLRVMDYAVELQQQLRAPEFVISGNAGNWTNLIWDRPEAVIFREYADNRLANCHIHLETEATNFGQNVSLSKALLPDAKVVTFVTKPNAVLRVLLTAQKQWPEITPHVTAPPFKFPDHISRVVGVLGLINEMVGDIERIQRYSALGYQAEHHLPSSMLASWQFLVKRGFTEHLL